MDYTFSCRPAQAPTWCLCTSRHHSSHSSIKGLHVHTPVLPADLSIQKSSPWQLEKLPLM